MKRRLKSTLLVVLALAVGGVGAGSAQAEPLFEADSYTATVDGVALKQSVFTFGGIYQWECKSSPFEGKLLAKSSSLTLSALYAECRWMWPVTEPPIEPYSLVQINMNGCDWKLNTLKFQKADEYTSLVNLECPAGKQVVIELHRTEPTICKLTVPAQSGKSDVRLIDKTASSPNDVEAQVTISGLNYTQDLSHFIPELNCPLKPGSYTDLAYAGLLTLTATSEPGKQIGFRVTGE